MTFTIGRGTNIVRIQRELRLIETKRADKQVCAAIEEVAKRVMGKELESMFENMGKVWDYLTADSQLRWYVRRSAMTTHSLDPKVLG